MSDVLIPESTESTSQETPQVQNSENVASVTITPEDVAAATQGDSFVMPKKFEGKTAEEIAKSYMELEKMKGVKPEESPEVNTETVVEENTETEETETQEETPQVSNLQEGINKYSDIFQQKGKLDPEDYENIQKEMGFDKATVDQFIRGKAVVEDDNMSEFYGVFGGKEQTEQATSWASQNLSPEEITKINRIAESSPEAAAMILKSRYEHMVPQSGKSLKGNTSVSNSGDIFKSQAEMMEAMNHPQYNLGGAYDEAFNAKLARSVKARTIQ